MDLKDHKDAVPDSRLANAKTPNSRDAKGVTIRSRCRSLDIEARKARRTRNQIEV